MRYVTRGTIQLVDTGNPANDCILINPTDDYSVKLQDKKLQDKRYLVLIEVPEDQAAPNGNARIVSLKDDFSKNGNVSLNNDFSFEPVTPKDSLRTAAFKQTVLELIVSEVQSSAAAQPSRKYTVTQITIPATPSVLAR